MCLPILKLLSLVSTVTTIFSSPRTILKFCKPWDVSGKTDLKTDLSWHLLWLQMGDKRMSIVLYPVCSTDPSADYTNRSVVIASQVTPGPDTSFSGHKCSLVGQQYVCITFISDSAIQNNIVIQCWGPQKTYNCVVHVTQGFVIQLSSTLIVDIQ